jgi:7tm Chemosensory receptor
MSTRFKKKIIFLTQQNVFQMVALLLTISITIAQHFYKNEYHRILLRLDECAAITTKYSQLVRKRSRSMTAYIIITAMILLFEETYNWGDTFDSLLSVIFAWLLTIMGLLVTFKMLIVVFAIRVILRQIDNRISFATAREVKLGYLIDVHASLCELAGETNRIFRPVLMCSHMMNFINLLTGTYFITLIVANLENSFVAKSGPILLGTTVWIIFSAASVVMLCTECDKTVHEVKNISGLKKSNLIIKIFLGQKMQQPFAEAGAALWEPRN